MDKGGTGKLKSFWETNLYKVVEKSKNIPVYTIEDLCRPGKKRRKVHRSLILKCNDLPLDIFEVEDVARKNVNTRKQTKYPLHRNTEKEPQSSDDEEESYFLLDTGSGVQASTDASGSQQNESVEPIVEEDDLEVEDDVQDIEEMAQLGTDDEDERYSEVDDVNQGNGDEVDSDSDDQGGINSEENVDAAQVTIHSDEEMLEYADLVLSDKSTLNGSTEEDTTESEEESLSDIGQTIPSEDETELSSLFSELDLTKTEDYLSANSEVPSLSENGTDSDESIQGRPQRERRPTKVFTYSKLGKPSFERYGHL